MNNLLFKTIRKVLAIVLVLAMVFSTNSFNALSEVYADNTETTSMDETSESNIEEESTAIEEEESSSVAEETEGEEESSTTESADETTTIESSEEIESTTVEIAAEETIESESSSNEVEETTEETNKLEEVEEVAATESEVSEETSKDDKDNKPDYLSLDAFSQVTYYDSDAAYLDGDVIKLNKDIELIDALYFKDNKSLDLAGHDIIGPDNNYAIYVENNFTLYNEAENIGSIKSKTNKYPVIYIKDAKAEFAGGKVLAIDGDKVESENALAENGGDAIHSYNSSLTFSGAYIYAGSGEESNDCRGGNGGDAVKVIEAKNSDKIIISEGSLTGGSGANGIGDEKPESGAALKVNGIVYESEYFGHGLPGNVGGGNGGVALNITTKKFKSKNLTYEKYTLYAGHTGYSQDFALNEEAIENSAKVMDDVLDDYEEEYDEDDDRVKLRVSALRENNFGSSPDDSFYSLHQLDGKNYLTSLKYQRDTDLCTAFSTTAYAETALIAKYPDFVKDVLNKNVDATYDLTTWQSNADELNLSEMQFAMSMQTQPRDEFGNAGLSSMYKDGYTGSNWAHRGYGEFTISNMATTWRSFVEEDATLAWSDTTGSSLTSQAINRDLLNNYTDKTVAHARSAKIYDASTFYNGTTFNRDSFIRTAKEAIINNAGIVFCVFTCEQQHSTNFNYQKDGVDYGTNLFVVTAPAEIASSVSLGGHAMYCIGWDDDIDITTIEGDNYHGAFICKNSWDQFSFVPYATNFGLHKDDGSTPASTPNQFMSFISIDFVPSFTNYENIYFYDSGLGLQYRPTTNLYNPGYANNVGHGYFVHVSYNSILQTFKIRNNKEKVKAASVYVDTAGRYKMSIYKVSSLDNKTNILNSLTAANKLSEVEVDMVAGVNTVDLPNVDVNKDDFIAVMVSNPDGNTAFGKAYLDTTYNGGADHYSTVAKDRGFYTNPIVSDVFKIRVGTNEYLAGSTEFNTYYDANFAAQVKALVENSADYKIDDEENTNFRIRLITNNYIKLNANGSGDYGGAASTYIYPTMRGALTNLSEPENVPDNKLFLKYNTSADGNGTDYDEDSIYHLSIAKQLELYAIYDDVFALTFNANGGSGTMEPIKKQSGESLNVPGCTFTRTGYTFAGWVDENNVAIAVNSSMALTRDRTLSATWAEKEYAINYELNDGAFVSGYDSYKKVRKYSKDVELPSIKYLEKSGFNFVGWYDNKDFNGKAYTRTEAANTEKVLTYYAKWEAQSSGGGDKSGSKSGGGSTGGGGGSGKSVAGLPNGLNPLGGATNDTKLTVPMSSVPMNYASSNSTWTTDASGAYHLSIVNANGERVEAKNTFMCVTNEVMTSTGQKTNVLDYYYFDAEGKMYTGWLRDQNNMTYYFDKNAGANIGKLTRGWAQIDGSYYYFDGNGALLTNGTTPDGYIVGVDGKWVEKK